MLFVWSWELEREGVVRIPDIWSTIGAGEGQARIETAVMRCTKDRMRSQREGTRPDKHHPSSESLSKDTH
jgi:hypothetical protein